MRSIRQQLTATLLLSLFLVVIVCGVLLFTLIKKSLTRDFDAALLAKARALSALAMQEISGNVEVEFSEEMMPAFTRPDRPDYYEFWYENGQPLARSKSLGIRHLAFPGYQAKDYSVRNQLLPDGRLGRAVSLSFTPAKDPDDFGKHAVTSSSTPPVPPAPRVALMVAQSRGSLDQTLRHMFWLMTTAGFLLPLLIALVVWLTVKKGLRPLDRLARETEAIDSQNLAHRFDEGQMPRELQPIGHRLNALIERLETSFTQIRAAYERERRFSDNVAHELRTPIAELHALAEVALMFPHNQQMGQNAHNETLAIALQMERLVAMLLRMTRCEAGIEKLSVEPVHLGEVVDKARTHHQDRMTRRRIVFHQEIPANSIVSADLTLLNSIISNLVSNAVDHCPEDGVIRTSLSGTDTGSLFRIENTNDALTAEDLAFVFDPFWQKDSARTSSTHSGLGLTLTKSLCQLMGIALTATLENGNFAIELLFPQAVPSR